jgi:hypothetical protein
MALKLFVNKEINYSLKEKHYAQGIHDIVRKQTDIQQPKENVPFFVQPEILLLCSTILIRMNTTKALSHFLVKIHSNINVQYIPRYLQRTVHLRFLYQKFLRLPDISHARYIPLPSQSH